MKKEQKLTVVGVVLVALLGAVYLTRKDQRQEAEAHTVTAASDKLPKIAVGKDDAAKITKLVIDNADKGSVTLEKKDDKWRLTAPLEAAANASNVDSVLKNLEKIEISTVIVQKPAKETLAKYDLEGKKAVKVQAFAGDKKLLHAVFGKSGGRGQMVKLPDQEAIYAAKGYSSYLYAREVKNWRDMDIVKIEDKDVTAVELVNSNGKLGFNLEGEDWKGSFVKRDDKGELAKKAAKWDRFDGEKVKDMLRAYKNLKATDFGKTGDDHGLDDAEKSGGVLTITTKKSTYTLRVGKKQGDGGNRYLGLEGDAEKTVYVISSWAADWAAADQDKFSKPEDKKDKKDAGEDDGDGDDKGKKDKDKKGAKKDDKKKGAKPAAKKKTN